MHNNVNPFEAPTMEGLVDGLTLAEYHALDGVSRSTLIRLLRMGPWAFDFERQRGFEESDAMRLGSACHTAVLEPDLFCTFVVEYAGTRRGPKWEEFKAEADAAGTTVLTKTQYATCERLRKYVAGRKGIRNLLDRGMAEKSLFHMDEETGVRVKVRPDFLDPEAGFALDLKFPGRIDGKHRQSQIWEHGYHMQAAMFLEGANRVFDGAIKESFILWIRTTGAPEVEFRSMPQEWMDLGRQEYREALDLYAKCTAKDEWPRPKLEIQDERFPQWLQEKQA